MAAAISYLITIFLVVEFLIMLLLSQLNFGAGLALWLDPLIDASGVSLVAVYAVPWVLKRASISLYSSREWIQLKSALIVFGVEAVLMLLIPLLELEIDALSEALLDAIVLALLATLTLYLWVLQHEQFVANYGLHAQVAKPYRSPWLTSGSGYLFGLLLIGLMLLTLFRTEQDKQLSLLGERQLASLSLVQSVLIHELHNSLQDTLVISRRSDLVSLVTNRWLHLRQQVQQEFRSIVSTRGSYYSIRYLDRNEGRPLIAVNDHSDADLDSGIVSGRMISDQKLLDDSTAMQAGEVRMVPMQSADGAGPISLAAPVFDTTGQHQGVLVVTLNSDNLIQLVTSNFQQPYSSLALLSEQGAQWIVTTMRSGEQTPVRDDGLSWAGRSRLDRGVIATTAGLASYYSLRIHPVLFSSVEQFAVKGGWPDWKLYSLLPRSWIDSNQLPMIQLYLLVFSLLAIVAGVGTFAYTRIYIRQLESERQVYMMAHHDSLTGLDNRLLFREKLALELQHAQRNQTWLGVMYLDLDRFKPVNDQYGHDVGDEALKAVVTRLRPLFRSSDSFARIGGDEFAVVLPAVSGLPELETIAQRLLAAMEPEFELLGNYCDLGVSIGISLCRGDIDIDALIRHADSAMYDAKADPNSGYKINIAEAVVYFDQPERDRAVQ